jgi:hypothetical protein
MRQRNDSILRRLAGALQDQYDDIARQPLPRRWVDLIHYLDEQERKAAERSQTETEARDRRRH